MSEGTSRELTNVGKVIIDHHETIGNIVMDENVPIINVANVFVKLFELDLKSENNYLTIGEQCMKEILETLSNRISVQTLVEYGIITEYEKADLIYYYLSSPYKEYAQGMEVE